MRLILIRHGESEHSLRGMIAGYASCPGLTARGFQQSNLLADRLHATGEASDCVMLLSSTVLRARQTAEVLGHELHLGSVEQDCDLCELHPGVADVEGEVFAYRVRRLVLRQAEQVRDGRGGKAPTPRRDSDRELIGN